MIESSTCDTAIGESHSPGRSLISDWEEHHALKASIEDGQLRVVTSSEQWSYAISFPKTGFELPSLDAVDPNQPVLFCVTSKVTDGCVGIGLVRDDRTSYISETQRTVVDGCTTTKLYATSLADCYGIVVRNCRDGGSASTVTISSIEIVMGSELGKTYPVYVARRSFEREEMPSHGGVETFENELATSINAARMAHLDSLQLPLSGKSVLDVGCGVGHFSRFYKDRNCSVCSVDGREENIDELGCLYPDIEGFVADVQRDALSQFGRFDIVHCYGLLYHLENPVGAMRNIESVCNGFALIETIVCDSAQSLMLLADEPKSANQALEGIGCRPSPSFIVEALNRVGFDWVYAAKSPPNHGDFLFDWRDDLACYRNGANLRCIFVASRDEQHNPNLVSLLG